MAEWFYGKGGQQHGPLDEAALRARIAGGEISPTDLIWTEGMAAWTPLAELPQFAITTPDLPMGEPVGGGVYPVAETVGAEPSSPYAPPAASLAGAQYQPGPGVPATDGLAIASLVCGILSLVFFCFCGGIFFGVPAVICGHLSLNKFKVPGNQQKGRGMALAGLICGYLGLAVFAFMILAGNINANGF